MKHIKSSARLKIELRGLIKTLSRWLFTVNLTEFS